MSRNGSNIEGYHGTDPWTAQAFLPALSVRRQVIFDGEIERSHKHLKRELNGRKTHGYAVAPEELCIVAVEQQALLGQMRAAGIKPYRGYEEEWAEAMARRVENIAVSMQLGLTKLLQNTSPGLQLDLGETERFQDGRAVGRGPLNWPGYDAGYHQLGSNGNSGLQLERAEKMSSNAILLAEKQLCLGALAVGLADEGHTSLDLGPLIGEPHIAFLMRKGPLVERKFQRLKPILDGILPETVTLADPVVHAQLWRDEPPLILPVWPREEVNGRFRLQVAA